MTDMNELFDTLADEAVELTPSLELFEGYLYALRFRDYTSNGKKYDVYMMNSSGRRNVWDHRGELTISYDGDVVETFMSKLSPKWNLHHKENFGKEVLLFIE